MANNIGICSICGEEKKLTFEHYPPQSAFNKNPVLMKDHRHILPLNDHLYGKSMRSNRGFGGFRLCKTCNNNTGSWYANDYVEFVKSSIPFIEKREIGSRAIFEIEIAPLNILKQVLTIHLCADQVLGALRSEIGSKEFILERENRNLKDSINIYMYATMSLTHRFMGLAVTSIDNLKTFGSYSEFNFHPFGFLLTIDSVAPNLGMQEISSFKKFHFNERVKVKIDLPVLDVKSIYTGIYP